MSKCIIFCAAGFSGLLAPPEEGDHLIAADGGLAHVQALGLQADTILGDFDSLSYVPTGANVFPVEKDDTDAMLAVRHGLSLGFREFHLYGSLDGPRLDHTLANFQTLLFLEEHGAWGTLIGNTHLVTTVKKGSLIFPAGCTGTLSVFCLGKNAQGVTISGAYYGLDKGTLTAAFPLGVSNHFTGTETEISVEEGALLLIFDRGNPLPERKHLC